MPADVRAHTVHATSTETFGRVLASARHHHVVVDGPAENGCPGEALTPAELFLAGVATCGVELLHVIAAAEDVPLQGVTADVSGSVDRSRQARTDVTVFSSVRLHLELAGIGDEAAAALVEAFKRR